MVNMTLEYVRAVEFEPWLYNLPLISVKYLCWTLLIEEEFKPTYEGKY
jgi:hypothetical protein